MMTSNAWIIPSNSRFYAAEEALCSSEEIYWTEKGGHFSVGDTVYLYGTKPQQQLTHELVVLETGIEGSQALDDEEFWQDKKQLQERADRSRMRLRLVRTFTPEQRRALALPSLVAAGMAGAPQGRQHVKPGVMRLIEGVLRRSTINVPDAVAEGLTPDPDLERSFERQLASNDFAVTDDDTSADYIMRMVRTRGSAQAVFAREVKKNYGYRCAVTGITTREFLVASHIVPWASDATIRIDPSNGICLSTLVDRAFDMGFLRITPERVVEILWDRLADDPVLRATFKALGCDGRRLADPIDHPANTEHLRRRFDMPIANASKSTVPRHDRKSH